MACKNLARMSCAPPLSQGSLLPKLFQYSTIQQQKNKAIFNIKERVLGKKKDVDGPTAVVDPVTKVKTFEPKEILKVCADYCVNLLKNKEPSEGFQEDMDMKKIIHNVRMKETIEDDIQFSREMFNQTFDILKKKKKTKYDFILKAGPSLHNALFKLYKEVWNGEVKPDAWHDTVIIQLDKGQPDKANLDSKRHIHT